jgi:cystatin-A/B
LIEFLIHDSFNFKLKDEIHTHAKKTFPHLKAISFKTQVVAGTNYFIKVLAGNEHIHLKVHKPLPVHGGKPQLSSVQLGKQQNDPISFF